MRTLILLSVVIILASCSNLSPFTKNLYERYDWSNEDLQRIQFYLSDDIILKRQLVGGKQEIINGDVKIIDGKKVEIVKIPKGTPGVFEFMPDQERMAIRFEENSDNFLMFGPNPRYSGRYMLLASEWNRRSGKVHYDGKTYRTEDSSQLATLMIDLKKLGRTEVKSRTARGAKVNK